MQTYDLDIRNRQITCASEDSTLVQGSVGIDKVRLRFYDSEWWAFQTDGTIGCAMFTGEIEDYAVTLETPQQQDAEWLYECTLDVSPTVTYDSGPLGVTVYGERYNDDTERDEYIVTAEAYPLTVLPHGITEGDEPSPIPQP